MRGPGGPRLPLTPEQLGAARQFIADNPGASWDRIGAHIGCTTSKIRYALDAVYKAHVLSYNERSKRHGRIVRRISNSAAKFDQVLFDPKRDGAAPDMGFSHEHFGDPPPGRRELLEKFAATKERKGNRWANRLKDHEVDPADVDEDEEEEDAASSEGD